MDISFEKGRIDILMSPLSVTPSLDTKNDFGKKKRPKSEAQNDDDGATAFFLSFCTTLKKHVNLYLFTLPTLCSH